jgi:hypothetical protein
VSRSRSPRYCQIPIQIYRGRGDTLPRGFGGSIYAAVSSQLYTSPVEHHTEQNRYLRRYFSVIPSLTVSLSPCHLCIPQVPAALNHLHTVYSAHLFASAQLPPPGSARFQRYFTFMGRLSSAKWYARALLGLMSLTFSQAQPCG